MSGLVYCIGETVLDILFRENEVVCARPGGSMLNTAVSLGRAGIQVQLISDFGDDPAGELTARFLRTNHVRLDHVVRYSDGRTAIALAFLDENGEATYSFYKNYPRERQYPSLPQPGPRDIVLFGSFYSLTPEVRSTLKGFLSNAKHGGSRILYDPNFRASHLPELEHHLPRIVENISMANVVRGSDEDFRHICRASDAEEAFDFVRSSGCDTLIYTMGKNGVVLARPGKTTFFPIEPVTPVSAIGAGDAFNAGLIWQALQSSPEGSQLASEMSVRTAIRFSTDVCGRLDNYIGEELVRELSAIPPMASAQSMADRPVAEKTNPV